LPLNPCSLEEPEEPNAYNNAGSLMIWRHGEGASLSSLPFLQADKSNQCKPFTDMRKIDLRQMAVINLHLSSVKQQSSHSGVQECSESFILLMMSSLILLGDVIAFAFRLGLSID
jgi:hypothetical protein